MAQNMAQMAQNRWWENRTHSGCSIAIIKTLIQTIIVQRKTSKDAQQLITNAANDFPEAGQQKFIEVVETELMSLHDGNFSRYHVTPDEYKRWKAVWN